jgi:pimeloyl-ACP methyl ester carboxylesterase
MRVASAGLEARQPGQPVVVFESGAGDGLESWRPVFEDVARLAPVVAYDRRGIGGSAIGAEPPTLAAVARSLRALLRTMQVAPPYVLVGHSWGGAYITAFGDQFPADVAGLVYVDATDASTTREERAAVLPAEQRAEALRPPVLPPIPPDTPPGLRAEMEAIGASMLNDEADIRALKRLDTVPVAVIVATPPGRMRGAGGAVTRLAIQKRMERILGVPAGLFITANHVGHFVHRDDPDLVVAAIRHVLAPPRRP